MLEVKNIKVAYGKTVVIHDLSLNVQKGELVTLLGANGAGKTITLKTIVGLLKPMEGEIIFEGEDISKIASEQIVKRGISLCPEGRHVWPKMTIDENLTVGGYTLPRNEVEPQKEKMYELFPRLLERKYQKAGSLSGGEQQMLAIARTMMAKPRFILFDEPSLGLAPIIIEQILDIIATIRREENATVLLVEQNANMALSISDRGYVMESGLLSLEGNASDLRNNAHVKKAYLGK